MELTRSGLGYEAVRHEIQSIHESQRKLTETLTKSRKEVQETYTQSQWKRDADHHPAVIA